jgi:hypothetical protein
MHGIAATMGKMGAIIASVWIVNISNPRNVFIVSSLWAVAGGMVTWAFLPDTTGMDLKDLDEFHACIDDHGDDEHRFEDYHSEAVNPKHMSRFEIMNGWSKHYDRRHCGHTPKRSSKDFGSDEEVASPRSASSSTLELGSKC